MHLVEIFTYVVSLFSFSRVEQREGRLQTPLLDLPYNVASAEGPIFKPPTGSPQGREGGDLLCDYRAMGSAWQPCSTPDDRGCWLQNSQTQERYDIRTDYDDPTKIPTGINRYYSIVLSNGTINADGLPFLPGKFFWNMSDSYPNDPTQRYPGPWIQACWGDTVHVNLYNNHPFNGTTIHWHGVRQQGSFDADGVPGLTQCPIAPGDNFTYSFRVTQYGSSWYHSHYSLQYADGSAGPLTFHGPSSSNWDEPKFPLMMTDWRHNSAFEAIWTSLVNQSTLFNGIGNVTRYNNLVKPTMSIPAPYSISVSSSPISGRPRRYLLRLINMSFESMFVFTIDNHLLTVITTDFVPIKPYVTTNVRIGIGQRYNVILEAKPNGSTGKSFWMRAYRPECFNANFDDVPSRGYERAGIVYYDGETKQPSDWSSPWPIDYISCSDEPYYGLQPVVPWTIGPPAKTETDLEVNLGFNIKPQVFPLAGFSVGGKDFNPLQINYSNPMILNLTWNNPWQKKLVVYPETYNSTDWVWLP